MSRPTLSVSRMKYFLSSWNCELFDYWRYVKGNWPPMPPAVGAGSAAHSALEHYFRQKAVGRPATVPECEDVFHDRYDGKLETGEVVGDQEDIDAHRSMVSKLVRKWIEHRGESLVPRSTDHIEWRFVVPMSGVSHDLKGVIDLVADRVDVETGEVLTEGELVDFKVLSRRPSQSAVDDDLQLTAYNVAYRQLMDGERSPVLTLEVMLKQKSLPVDGYPSERSEAQLQWFLRLFAAISRRIDAGAYVPTMPGQMPCTPSKCEHWDICRGSLS